MKKENQFNTTMALKEYERRFEELKEKWIKQYNDLKERINLISLNVAEVKRFNEANNSMISNFDLVWKLMIMGNNFEELSSRGIRNWKE
jgi:hypothetical protein